MRLLRNSEELAGRHQIVTRFETPKVEALVDANMIKQVFWNLAKNALKAMPGGGALTIRGRVENPSTVVISFADEGCGMTEAEIQCAFQPFHTKFSEGTGLGLAVVFRIIQEHGGRIRVKSRKGAGTEVILTLPAARTAARELALAGESIPA